MPLTLESLATQVKYCRKQHGISQEKLAEIAEVSLPSISRLERGKATIRFDLLMKILDSLGLQLEIIPKTPAKPHL